MDSARINDIPRDRYLEHRDQLIAAFEAVRKQTTNLTAGLSAEDMQIQSMPDASPGKWHLAHTSWFFEAFILCCHQPEFKRYKPSYANLFNSYYNAMGEPFPRAMRGMISRPGLDEVLRYRDHITAQMVKLLGQCAAADFQQIAPLLVLGVNHEQQHQELILTDIKHAMFQNPTYPAVFVDQSSIEEEIELCWHFVAGGEVSIGYDGEGFCFDNELPCHRVLIEDFQIASRPVSNSEWLEFMLDGGYEQPALWLSDGWDWCNRKQIRAPLYWVEKTAGWQQFNLTGLKPLAMHAPVTHISYYEADAFTRWSGHRLPTEHEWETASRRLAKDTDDTGSQRWEWTASPYAPYPGYHPSAGMVSEYNGKFMINQIVMRGASEATTTGHSRPSYRNFFYPQAQWQFSTMRLVNDG